MYRSLSVFALVLPAALLAQEVCNNGVDDDGNGLVDLNDPACPCSTLLSGTPSFIPNPSFEQMVVSQSGNTCCPYGYNLAGSQPWFNCAEFWQQATVPTTDLFHSCGLYPDVFPVPPPDGEAFVGMRMMQGWQEYVGACLTDPGPPTPLLAGVEYTLTVHVAGTSIRVGSVGTSTLGAFYSDPIPLALYGRSNCVSFPVNTAGCPVPEGWVELASMDYQANGQWDQLSFTFTPGQEIRTVMFGTGCVLPASFIGQEDSANYTPYLLLDDLHLTAAIDQVTVPVMSAGHICQDDVLVTADPPTGLTAPLWYHNGVALVGQAGPVLDVAAAGTGSGLYTYAGTYEGECLMGSTQVAVPDAPVPWMQVAPVSGCVPLQVAFTDVTGPLSVASAWTFGDGGQASGATTTHTYAAAGSYDVGLHITTAAGCERDTTVVGAVVVHPLPVGALSATPAALSSEDPVTHLSGVGSAGDILSWWWDLGDASPPTSTAPQLTATFPAEPGNYPVVLVVTTAMGCTDTVRSVVVVTMPGVVSMPNVFSPNGDGHNDHFVPVVHHGSPAELSIYNRWGQLLHTTKDLAKGWNGRDVPEGTYFYVVTPDDATMDRISGHVTLVR